MSKEKNTIKASVLPAEVPAEKIRELLARMTLEEKCRLITGGPESLDTASCERLGIAAKHLADGPHGVRNYAPGSDCTLLPSMSALGATFDRKAAYLEGRTIGRDCIHQNRQMILGPGLNIKRSPLNGRNFEYVSEDPVLTGQIAGNYVKGCEETGTGTSMKHFAVNSQETNRTESSAEVDERTLQEIYLKGFRMAEEIGHPSSIMCAYNKINSLWCSENPHLLTEILRNDWHYEGIMISDWGAVHDEAKALHAGMDLRMPGNPQMPDLIRQGIQDGICTEEDVDRAAGRVLNFLLRPVPDDSGFDRAAQHEAAVKVARESITLLRNRGGLLPLTPQKVRKLCVTGEYAIHPYVNGQGSAEVFPNPEHIDCPLECLRRALPGVQVDYFDYLPAREPEMMLWNTFRRDMPDIESYDAVLVFTGYQPSMDSENLDRYDNHLAGFIENVLHNVVFHNPKAILILTSGSSTFRSVEADKFPAIVQMWPAGEGAGTAIAEILTGKVNPSGKLSETFPTCLRKDLDYTGNGLTQDYSERWRVGYRYYDLHPEEIWFPFGHGLSYTRFVYQDLVIRQEGTSPYVQVSFTLINAGDRDGAEAVQLYVSDPVSTVSKPVKELADFEKVFLAAGEKKEVSFLLNEKSFSYYNDNLHRFVVENGRYNILIGASSRDIRLSGAIMIDDPKCYTIRKVSEDMIG